MNRIVPGVGALLLLSTSMAQAGALDRSGQPVTAIFEPGNYAELSFGFTQPDVQGVLGPVASGNVGVDYATTTLAFKYDLTDQLSFAVIVDEPFGADVDYGEADRGYPIAGSTAVFETTSVTALGRYEFSDNLSVHAGARLVRVDADLFVNSYAPTGVGQTYQAEFDTDEDVGFVIGGAYERPEIALRVALTYSSETSFSHDTTYSGFFVPAPGTQVPFGGPGTTSYTLPQSVNLDFRTGIAQDTAIFGSVRWVDWSSTEIVVPDPYAANPVVSYEDDIVTYTLGVGRRFTDELTGTAAVIYEPATGSDFDRATGTGGVSNLSPTSGQLGVQLAATYALNENIELTGAVRYTRLGDVTTRSIGASFEDNDALTAGLRVGFRF